MEYYSSLIESDELTVEELKELLINSEEKIGIIKQDNMPISEISDETKDILNDLYQEVLYRDVDLVGLQIFGPLLENKQITVEEMRQKLLDSEEKKYTMDPAERKTIYELSDEIRNLVNDTYRELLFRSVDKWGLEYYGNMLESNRITAEEFREIVLESDEHKMLMKNTWNRAENRP